VCDSKIQKKQIIFFAAWIGALHQMSQSKDDPRPADEDDVILQPV
jgi:hypothetical protein